MRTVTGVSIVTPAWNEADNLPLLHASLVDHLARAALDWEWIVVDDGSVDATPAVLTEIAARDSRVRGVRLPQNGGSHAAMLRGFAESHGTVALLLAADLQDPPELCAELVGRWQAGADVVWAVRRETGQGWLTTLPSRLYHGLLRHTRGARGLPPGGAGSFLVDRTVVEILIQRSPPPVDLFAAVGRLPLRAATVLYDRRPRQHGRSGWSFRKKIRFALRSLRAPR
jgi:glycosyltransferase involved in cell wall biosynthesis